MDGATPFAPMSLRSLASASVTFVERIPVLFWAAWIVGVVGGTAALALRAGAAG